MTGLRRSQAAPVHGQSHPGPFRADVLFSGTFTGQAGNDAFPGRFLAPLLETNRLNRRYY